MGFFKDLAPCFNPGSSISCNIDLFQVFQVIGRSDIISYLFPQLFILFSRLK